MPAVADALGITTAAQVGPAWLLAHHERTLLIPGTAEPAHLVENLDAAAIELGPDALARLDALVG
jgi:aryl-alcohol dehydrogenase-like predicted oxidoreductase